MKNSNIFHISVQNIDCGYSLDPPRRGGSNEYPQSMLLSRNKKNNVYPCKPQFYYIKVGFKGVKLYRYVFMMFVRYKRIRRWISSFEFIQVGLTLSALLTNTDTFANSVNPGETTQNKPSHQDLYCLPFCSWFTIVTLLATRNVSKFRDRRVLVRNSGWKV